VALKFALTLSSFMLCSVFALAQADSPEYKDADEEDFAQGIDGVTGTEDSDPVAGLRWDRPRFQGRGCPPGTVTSSLSTDQTSLSLLFDNYIVQSGNSPTRREVMNCEILIPVQVPPGYRMMIGRIDYRGFAQAPMNGRSVLRTVTQILNERGQALSRPLKRRRVFAGPINQNFAVSSRVLQQPHWSSCGENFQLRLRTDLIAVANRRGEPAMTAMDTIDATGSVTEARAQYFMRWKKCARGR
jgi:hypothetical protein